MKKVNRLIRSRASVSDPPYCPDLGDLIFLDFSPQAGREQADRRPALVLSARAYNSVSRLCVVCPLTRQVKGYPFEVSVPAGGPLAFGGAVLVDHVKSLSWEARNAQFIGKAPSDVMPHVRGLLRALLKLD